MLPLQKAVPERRRSNGVDSAGGGTQAGRNETNLEAEKNSAELRSKRSLRNNEGSPYKSQRTPSMLSTHRRPSYAPIVPSPLNPSSTQSSLEDSEKISGSTERDSTDVITGIKEVRSHSMSEIPTVAKGRPNKKTSVLSPARQLLRKKSAPVRPEIGYRTETPKTLKDLGRDYSRYPTREDRPSSVPALQAANVLLLASTSNGSGDSRNNLDDRTYPDDSIGAFDPYFGEKRGFILYANEVEDDDKYHNPTDNDDYLHKPRLRERFSRRSIVSSLGACFLVLGLISIFIILPVVTFTTGSFRKKSGSSGGIVVEDTGPAWAHVNNNSYALLNNVRRGLIDPDTAENVKTRISTFDGTELELVFSDEFNTPNRTFYPGDDPYWTAANIWYGATEDLEWYDPDAITTADGTLQIKMDAFFNHNLQYRSGMLNSWNQLCFKGGVFEVSISLAGPAGVPGLWPGVWSMGNLGRPGYRATTDGVWPYTYNSCDAGITPNQSSPDGLSWLPGQKLSSCSCPGADHPSPGTGRGAPEIDILEASVDPRNLIGVVTQSAQIAPFDVEYRPNHEFLQIPNYDTTAMNAYCGGPYQQAVSGTTLLNNDWYNGTAYQKYAFEYIPGTSSGKIAWFVGDDQTFMMDGRSIGPNGNVGARQISEEPMSMVLNLGMSGSWSQILLGELKWPTVMHIDYVRIYQKAGNWSMGCDPEGYETTDYIARHPEAYDNVNMTAWNQTGHEWPKNTLTGC